MLIFQYYISIFSGKSQYYLAYLVLFKKSLRRYTSLSHVKSGKTGRSRYVKCEVDMIELKTHFSDWREVDRATALRYCALLYNGITGRGRLAKTNAHVRGITFTGKELVNEYERISTERMREAT